MVRVAQRGIMASLDHSRPFVIKEIESGHLPHRKVGSHRRIALDRLADNARELGLDY